MDEKRGLGDDYQERQGAKIAISNAPKRLPVAARARSHIG